MLKVKNGFVIRKIGPQTVAVPVGKLTGEIHGVVALTESGALLWEKLTQGAEKDALVFALLNEYEIDEETASRDVDDFISGLYAQGVMEE